MFDVGDYVIVKRGMNVGVHGEVVGVQEPYDSGAPLLEIETDDGESFWVAADFVEKVRRP